MEKRISLLIVEDSEDDALMLLRQLRKSGYNPVYQRVTSREELRSAMASQNWDIVISDYVLPRFGGLEALNEVQAKDPDIPCIIVSGRITDETAVAAMKAGARDYVMKDNLKRIASVVERELAEAEVRRERRKAEKELQRAQLELRLMAQRLVELQEQERRQLARELHDEIGQSLTGLKLMMSQAARGSESERQAAIKESQSAISDLIRQVRELSLTLRPSMLDDLGLLPALLWFFERYNRQTRIKVNFEHVGLQRNFPLEISTAAYRIIQEALTNVARYARVNEVDVKIWADEELVTATIDDEGTGFNAQESLSRPSAGLSGMKERAQLLGGVVLVDSTPGEGTHVVAEIPLKETQNPKPKTQN